MRMTIEKAIIQLEPLGCPSCMQKIEQTVKALTGVDSNSAKLLFNTSKLKMTFDSSHISVNEIEQSIEELGYPVKHSKVL